MSHQLLTWQTMKGLIQMEKKDLNKAIAFFKTAAEADETYAPAQMKLGICLQKQSLCFLPLTSY